MARKKTTLWSFLAIGAVIAVVASAISIATFTDERTATVAIQAGTVSLAIDGDDVQDEVALTFVTGACGGDDPTNLGPGDTCNFDIEISNTGSLAFTVVIGAIEPAAGNPEYGAGTPCFTATWVTEPDSGAGNPYAPSGSSSGVLQVTLDAGAENECQGQEAGFSVLFTATYAGP